jgi:hypothetical protein
MSSRPGPGWCFSTVTYPGTNATLRAPLDRDAVRLRLPPQAARTAGPPEGADAPLNQSREAL